MIRCPHCSNKMLMSPEGLRCKVCGYLETDRAYVDKVTKEEQDRRLSLFKLLVIGDITEERYEELRCK